MNTVAGLQLRGDVLLSIDGADATFYGKKSFALRGLRADELSLLKDLRGGIGRKELERRAAGSSRVVRCLIERGMLKTWAPRRGEPGPLTRVEDWMGHFHSDPAEVLEALSRRKVLILGCGGTGSVIAMHLARSGLRDFTLIDGGAVDAPDLNRQLPFTAADCGKAKAPVLAAHLAAIDGACRARAYHQLVGSAADLLAIAGPHKPDLIINAADAPVGLIHAWVAEAAKALGVPALFGGVGLEDATIGPLLISAGAKDAYAADMRRAHGVLGGNDNILKASLAYTNSLAAVMIAFEAFKHLAGVGTVNVIDRAMGFSFQNFSMKPEKSWHG